MSYKKIVLVTGGAGFIGSNYLNAMIPRYPDYHFVNVDSLTYASNIKNITVFDTPNYVFEQTDIRDMRALEALWEKYVPTDIIHFAAESHVDNSIAEPDIFINTNIVGTHNLLKCAKKFNAKKFHHISTDEVYGSLKNSDPATTEEAPITPNSPYSASKASSDLLVRSYNKTYGLNTVISRASNNFGPHQNREKLIPLFINNLLEGKKVPIYGDGKNVRDWLYVGDHVEGIDKVFHYGESGEIYNLGGGKEMTNLEIANLLISILGRDESAIEYVTDRPGHDFRYAINSEKAMQKLGWKPEKDFNLGLQETIAYYRKN